MKAISCSLATVLPRLHLHHYNYHVVICHRHPTASPTMLADVAWAREQIDRLRSSPLPEVMQTLIDSQNSPNAVIKKKLLQQGYAYGTDEYARAFRRLAEHDW